MRNCPLKIDEDECERCHWNFGHDKCGIFSIAADMSYLIELMKELIALVKKR